MREKNTTERHLTVLQNLQFTRMSSDILLHNDTDKNATITGSLISNVKVDMVNLGINQGLYHSVLLSMSASIDRHSTSKFCQVDLVKSTDDDLCSKWHLNF